VSQKVPTFDLIVTLSNLNQFSKYLYCWNAYEICCKTHTTYMTYLKVIKSRSRPQE